MGELVGGDVVVVSFPFTDLRGEKRRPALVLASVGYGDCILCQITSRPWHEPAVELEAGDFQEGGLDRTSYARPDRVFTVHQEVVVGKVGAVVSSKLEEVRSVLRKVLA